MPTKYTNYADCSRTPSRLDFASRMARAELGKHYIHPADRDHADFPTVAERDTAARAVSWRRFR